MALPLKQQGWGLIRWGSQWRQGRLDERRQDRVKEREQRQTEEWGRTESESEQGSIRAVFLACGGQRGRGGFLFHDVSVWPHISRLVHKSIKAASNHSLVAGRILHSQCKRDAVIVAGIPGNESEKIDLISEKNVDAILKRKQKKSLELSCA